MSTAAKGVTLSLDLITANVRLEGVKDGSAREAVQFSEGHDCGRGTYTKLERRRWCPSCDIEVDYEDITKLRPVDGGYAPFSQEEVNELKEAALVSREKNISLTPHDSQEVLPYALPSGQAYYVYPDTGCNMDAYSALYDLVRRRTDRAFCTIFSIRKGTEYMGRLTIINDTLAIEVLLWPGDVSQPKPVSVSPSERASSLMDKIVDSMTAPFNVDEYRHQFRDLLAEAEKARVPGDGGIAVASLPKRAQKKDEDFFSLLEQVAEGSVKARKTRTKTA